MHNEFRSHALSDDGRNKVKTVAAAFDRCLTKVEEIIENGRELSIVRTKLEEAFYFAKKSAILNQAPDGEAVTHEPIIARVPPTTTIEACARAAHEVNRAYCIAVGDTSQPTWEDAPVWQTESAYKGVVGALNGNTPEQSHESWLAEKTATGWKYGPVKNPETKEHPCFVPYAELPPAQRMKDDLFVTTVRAVGKALGL